MNSETFVALLSLVGTFVGSVSGILTSSRLTNYRIKQLETKVDKHNGLIERMAVVELDCKNAHERIDKIEEVIK